MMTAHALVRVAGSNAIPAGAVPSHFSAAYPRMPVGALSWKSICDPTGCKERFVFSFSPRFSRPAGSARTYGSFLLLRSAYDVVMREISSVRAWMTLRYVATTYRVAERILITRLGLPPDTWPSITLKSLAERVSLSPFQYVQQVQRTIAYVAADIAPPEARTPSGWLERFRDEMLSALLVYSYPILGVTCFLVQWAFRCQPACRRRLLARCRRWAEWIGRRRPSSLLPHPLSATWPPTRSGALRASGSLRDGGAGLATGLKERRAQILFRRWGGLTVLLTRTLISHLSSIVSLLAGLHRYRLSAFLAYDMLGRAIWTLAYMGARLCSLEQPDGPALVLLRARRIRARNVDGTYGIRRKNPVRPSLSR